MSTADRKLVLIVDDTPTNVAVVSGVLKDRSAPKSRPTARRHSPSPPRQRSLTSSCSTS